MERKHKHRMAAVFLVVYVASYVLGWNIRELIPHIITAVSIMIGFYGTAVSSLFGRDYLKRLSRQIDPEHSTRTELKKLIIYFQNSAYCGMATFLAAVIYMIGDSNYKEFLGGLAGRVYSSALLALIFVNFIFLGLLFQLFLTMLWNESNQQQ